METNFDTLGRRMAESLTPTLEWNGRWYIAMGQPGFNTRANNRNGFASKARAEAQIRIWSRHVLRKMERDWKRSEKVNAKRISDEARTCRDIGVLRQIDALLKE